MNDRPVLITMFRRPRRVRVSRQPYLWAAVELGWAVYVVPPASVRVREAGVALLSGWELGQNRRWRAIHDEIVHPAAVLHRCSLTRLTRRVFRRIVARYPDVKISYHPAYDRFGEKWLAEEWCRAAEDEGVHVARPKTWLLHASDLRSSLASVASHTSLILKPPWGSQCRGIRVSTPFNWEDVFAELQQSDRHFVVQEIPAQVPLYRGKRFDIRFYALMWNADPVRCRVYREGIARIAATPMKSQWHESVVLTGDHYRARRGFDLDNVVTDSLLTELARDGVETESFWADVDVLVRNMFSVAVQHGPDSVIPLRQTFFLTGLDVLPVLFNGRLTPWFLEANDLPGLVDPIPAANDTLQAVNRQWLIDLKQVSPSAPNPLPTTHEVVDRIRPRLLARRSA